MTHNNDIEAQAAEWAARLDAGTLDSEGQHRLNEWLAGDSRRLGALIRARAHWTDRNQDRLDTTTFARADYPVESSPPFSFSRRMALVAGLACTSAAIFSWSVLRSETKRYRTGVGEIRRISLPDGSTAALNTDSEMSIELEPSRRTVRLVRGEGLFEVAHDPQRPFVVMVEGVQVRAVGTMFSVRLRGEEIDVTVSQGIVELEQAPVKAVVMPPQRLVANQQSTVIPGKLGRIEEIPPDVVRRRLAWLDGRVSFNGESLSQAVAEINRHSRRPVIVEDAELGARPIVGAFRSTDTQGFCRAVAVVFDVVAIEEEDAIHLRPKG